MLSSWTWVQGPIRATGALLPHNVTHFEGNPTGTPHLGIWRIIVFTETMLTTWGGLHKCDQLLSLGATFKRIVLYKILLVVALTKYHLTLGVGSDSIMHGKLGPTDSSWE